MILPKYIIFDDYSSFQGISRNVIHVAMAEMVRTIVFGRYGTASIIVDFYSMWLMSDIDLTRLGDRNIINSSSLKLFCLVVHVPISYISIPELRKRTKCNGYRSRNGRCDSRSNLSRCCSLFIQLPLGRYSLISSLWIWINSKAYNDF